MLIRGMTSDVIAFASLSDDQLLTETKRLVTYERRATAALLRSLMEVDSRRLYLREGCSSMFTYCTQVLHLGEGAAYNRIEAARAARRFPSVLPALEDGWLTLASVRLLAPHLTQENHDALMAAARHKSKRDVELLVATVAPKPPALTVLRCLPEKPQLAPASTGSRLALSDTTSSASDVGVSGADSSGPRAAGDESPDRAARAATTRRSPPPHAVTPLSVAHYRLQVTMTPETHDSSFVGRRTCCDMPRPTATSVPSLIAPSHCSSRISSVAAAHPLRRRAPHRVGPRAAATFPRRSAARCGSVTQGDVRSPAAAAAAPRPAGSSSITCSRTRREAVHRSRTFNCAAARTTCMRRGYGLDLGVTRSRRQVPVTRAKWESPSPRPRTPVTPRTRPGAGSSSRPRRAISRPRLAGCWNGAGR
jgi:hypothetical protein